MAFFEVVVEDFLGPSASAAAHLARARERAPIVLHGVSLGLLGPDPLDREHLRAVKRLADRLDAPCFSDHLCWTSAAGRHSHDLLPVPMSPRLARWAAARARQVQDELERPFGIENLSAMLSFAGSAADEWEFWRDVVEDAGCRYLLDVNNVFVSAANTGADPLAWLASVDPERVLYAHVAGHQRAARGPIVDTHDRPVVPEVWALYREAWARLGPFPTLLEWDDAIPPYDEALAELEQARRAREGVVPRRAPPSPRAAPDVPADVPPEVPRWQQGLLDLLGTPLAWEPPRARARDEDYPAAVVDAVRADALPARDRLRAYHEQYWFRLLTALQGLYPTLVERLGAWRFNQLASAYLVRHPPPAHDLGRVGDALPGFLAGSRWDAPEVRDAARLDRAWTALVELPAVPAWTPSPAELPGIVERRLRPSPTLVRLPLGPATWLLYRTPQLELVRREAPPALAVLLEELDRAPLGEALARVGERYPEVAPAEVRGWFELGVRSGWWAGVA